MTATKGKSYLHFSASLKAGKDGRNPIFVPLKKHPAARNASILSVGMSARSTISDPALGGRGTVFAPFEDLPFLPLGESAVCKKGVVWYHVDKGEHETMKNISWLAVGGSSIG